MLYNTIGKLGIIEFENLSENKQILHVVTTRKGGQIEGNFGAMNLSLAVGDSKENVIENRSKVCAYLNINNDRIFFPQQCHSDNIKVVSNETNIDELKETDALITNVKGLAIAILSADCVPILLFDPIHNAIAAIHAGWRGTIKNIAESAVLAMKKNYQSDPANLIAGIGPSISFEKYEVGEEVASLFRNLFGSNSKIIGADQKKGKTHIDLWEANKQLLIRCGLLSGNIEVAGICTFSHPELFFSARRDGISCGRFGSIIMLV
jgi:polyphenol oxidase